MIVSTNLEYSRNIEGSCSKTSIVVVGSDAGSKAAKAEELGIETLSEQQLLALLAELE